MYALRDRMVPPTEPTASLLHAYQLGATDEHSVWLDLADSIPVGPEAKTVAQYVITEMVNNAIDHSNGTQVSTAVGHDNTGRIIVTVTDDGEGVFRHLAEGLQLADTIDALAELTKGKQTTDPQRHTGEGIFFSSKAVDEFTLEANGYRLTFDNTRDDFAFGVAPASVGTVVRITLDPASDIRLSELFAKYTDEFEFNRTRPRIKLYELGVTFISRSEAKRLTAGLEEFADVDLDFAKVDDIGQGFADELFRVWAGSHPQTALHPTGMNSAVAFMVRRVTSTAKQ
ncbi:MAG: DUF4325 domain-containing protein [Actinomycetota bacterium]|nr:DUF4325 domain-containing protein [Actinomycetota bacterium]